MLGISLGVVLSQEKIRKTVLQSLHKIGESISVFLSQICNLIGGVIQEIKPYIEFPVAVVVVLFNNMQSAITEIQSL